MIGKDFVALGLALALAKITCTHMHTEIYVHTHHTRIYTHTHILMMDVKVKFPADETKMSSFRCICNLLSLI